MGYHYLALAIGCEVVATLTLKASQGFTQLSASVLCVVGYAAAFYFLSLVLKTVPIGTAYAIWAGMGIVLISLFGAIVYKQIPDLAAMLGMTLIIAGVVVINVFSTASGH